MVLKLLQDRVKMALLREEEEEMMPRKRKRKHKEKPDDTDNQCYASSDMRDLSSMDKFEEKRPPPKPRKMAPPPMDFNELLKIAQKKQFEPVSKVEPKVIVEEPERPMTKKQREEYLKEMEYRKRKEERDLARQNALKDRARNREDRRVNEMDREDRPPNKIPRLNESDERVTSDRLPKMGDVGEIKLAPTNRIPKSSDKYRTDSTQQRIPKLGDSSRPMFSQDRDSRTSDSRGQKNQASQMRIPKISNNNGGEDINLSSIQKLPKPNSLPSNNEERRMKLNFSKGELNRNRLTKDDERRLVRSEDQLRMKMKVSNDKDLYQRSVSDVGDVQGSRQATVSQECEQRSRSIEDNFNKPKTVDLKASKMNGNNSNFSGNLPKQLNNVKSMKDKTENKSRPTSAPSPLERKEVDSIRGKLGDQRRPSVNGVRPTEYSKKLQESLRNKFQQGRDDPSRKPDNFARSQNSNVVKDLKAPSKLIDGGLKNEKVIQTSQVRDFERRNGTNKPIINNGNRPAPIGGSSNGQDRKSLGGQQTLSGAKDKRPVPGLQLSGRPMLGERPKNSVTNEGRPKQFPTDDGKPRKFPPQDVRPRQFPPPDVKKARPFPSPDVRKKLKPLPSKREYMNFKDIWVSFIKDLQGHFFFYLQEGLSIRKMNTTLNWTTSSTTGPTKLKTTRST